MLVVAVDSAVAVIVVLMWLNSVQNLHKIFLLKFSRVCTATHLSVFHIFSVSNCSCRFRQIFRFVCQEFLFIVLITYFVIVLLDIHCIVVVSKDFTVC